MRKVYVVGASGYIGSAFSAEMRSAGREVVSVGRRACDGVRLNLAKPDKIALSAVDPGSFVLVAAAVSNPDDCERRYRDAYLVNVSGTATVIDVALARGCDVAFLSSDAVYASEPGAVYDECSPTEPRFAYGKMKKEIEDRFGGRRGFRALRLSYVFSAGDKVTSYLLACAREGRRAEVYHPYRRRCIALSDVVGALGRLEREWECVPDWRLNLAGTELVSRVRTAKELKRLVPSLEYETVSPPEGFYDVRPETTDMSSRYLYSRGICEAGPFPAKLKKELKGIEGYD